jgi:adenine-specific DNA-methyltransferase
MTSQKQTGSYYTPDFLSGFIMDYVSKHLLGFSSLSILEPSVGDGAFVKAFHQAIFSSDIQSFSFTGIDKIQGELLKAQKIAFESPKANTTYSFSNVDFLEIQKDLLPKYHFIAGNPPYISKKHLSDRQKELCDEIHSSANLLLSTVKNIWSAFLLRSCQLLTEDGILAFVLPAELLQVKFSNELRNFLELNFQRIEIFTFSELLFECKGQDTVLLISFKQHSNPGQYYTHISDTKDLINNDFILVENAALGTNDTKWSHHILESDELEYVYKLYANLNRVDYYCNSKPGIVTAANKFFIIDEETVDAYQLREFTHPIIQKGLFVNGSVVFNKENLRKLTTDGKPVNILVFNDNNSRILPERAEAYLQIGVDLEIPDRYKCTKRQTWFHIPNISTVPEAFFFKRSHLYPKLLKNAANILVTDSAYKVEMREGFDINSFIYSFYNSLTLLFAELEGRYYGGGVLELTPSEFKKVPLPYININQDQFQLFTDQFESKKDIEDILNLNDFQILNSALNLTNEDIERVRKIYKKLINKRLRKDFNI